MTRNKPQQGSRECSACPNLITTAKKVVDGRPFCEACYARLFKKRECTQCGGSVRVLEKEKAPICPKCRRKGRVCLRCGKPVVKAGMLVMRKPACASCAHHYRKPEPCEQCQTPSTRLSRIAGVTDQRVCEKCRRKLLCATCSQCGKHRETHSLTSDGEALCKSCAENPGSCHPCPDCGDQVGGVGSAPCMKCGVKRSVMKKTDAIRNLMSREPTRALLSQFVDWAIQSGRQAKVASGFDRYSVFLAKLDSQLQDGACISMELVGRLFEPEELRRAGLISQFLAEQGLLPSAENRSDQSESRRIEAILQAAAEKPWNPDMRAYAEFLAESGLKLRTRRMYLRAAAALLDSSEVSKARLLTDELIKSFVRAQPGYKASLMAWMTYLKQSGLGPAAELTPLRKSAAKEQPLKSVALHTAELLKGIEESHSEAQQISLLARLLALLFGVPLEQVLDLERGRFRYRNGVLQLELEQWIDIDRQVADWITRLLPIIASDPEEKIFAGRTPGEPLSSSATLYHLQRLSQGQNPEALSQHQKPSKAEGV